LDLLGHLFYLARLDIQLPLKNVNRSENFSPSLCPS
jgi:hypothetical protein